jgi:hypothetical protein
MIEVLFTVILLGYFIVQKAVNRRNYERLTDEQKLDKFYSNDYMRL